MDKRTIRNILLFIIVFSFCYGAIKIYKHEKETTPPEITTEVIKNNTDFSADIIYSPSLSGVNSQSILYTLEKDGSLEKSDEVPVYTRGGVIGEETWELLTDINAGKIICTQFTDEGLLAAYYNKENINPFLVVFIDSNKNVKFAKEIPAFTEESPAIYAMSMDNEKIYLFDYDEENEAINIYTTTINFENSYITTIKWEDIAGEYSDTYHLGGLIISPNHLVVENDILYIVEQHYGDGDGISRIFVSAYDIKNKRLIDVNLLGNCTLLSMKITDSSIVTLTNDDYSDYIILHEFDKSTLKEISKKEYSLPDEWISLTEGSEISFYIYPAIITNEKIVISLPYRVEENTDITFIAVYDINSCSLEYLNRLTASNSNYEVREVYIK